MAVNREERNILTGIRTMNNNSKQYNKDVICCIVFNILVHDVTQKASVVDITVLYIAHLKYNIVNVLPEYIHVVIKITIINSHINELTLHIDCCCCYNKC